MLATWIWHLNNHQWAVEIMTNGFQLNWELSGDKLLEDDRWRLSLYQESLTNVNDIRTKGNEEGEKRERSSENLDKCRKDTTDAAHYLQFKLSVWSVKVADKIKIKIYIFFSPQVVKMWSGVFTVIFLLSSIKWAKAQGINNSYPKSYPHVSVCCQPFSVSRVFAGRCNNVQAADIVFLIDGSSSIGRANFLQVKDFLARIVKPFAGSVSASGIRFGAIQYSDNSRWLTYSSWNKERCQRRIMCSNLFLYPELNSSSPRT